MHKHATVDYFFSQAQCLHIILLYNVLFRLCPTPSRVGYIFFSRGSLRNNPFQAFNTILIGCPSQCDLKRRSPPRSVLMFLSNQSCGVCCFVTYSATMETQIPHSPHTYSVNTVCVNNVFFFEFCFFRGIKKGNRSSIHKSRLFTVPCD